MQLCGQDQTSFSLVVCEALLPYPPCPRHCYNCTSVISLWYRCNSRRAGKKQRQLQKPINWFALSETTWRKEGKESFQDGWGQFQPGHNCPEDLGDVQQYHGGDYCFILVIILGYVCQYHGGVENFSETLLSLNSCCGIGKRWRWDLQIRQTAATKPTCCQTMG